MRRFCFILAVWSGLLLFGAPPARAQAELAGCRVYRVQSLTGERVVVKNDQGVEETHSRLHGTTASPVQIDCDEMQLFADDMEIFHEQNHVMGIGNVLYVSGGNRIYAERLEFDTRTRTGTFYNAAGTATLGTRVDRSFFGTQEPDAYFWGQEIQKLGPRKYRITRGGFTTCVQPTPRWEIASGSVTLTLDEHAVLTNSLFKVKGVPLMYLPLFYYPIQEDDRATGILIPTYGTSTIRGQSISNAFFWAIGRSHDATIYHDWFSKTGQGIGGEYRYQLSTGQGSARTYMLNEHETTYANADGTLGVSPANRNYQVTGSLTQALPFHLQGRASADYFTDLGAQQRYQQNVYYATNRSRRFGGNVSGTWRAYALSATLESTDIFYTTTKYQTTGSLPRITFTRAERPVGGSKMYFGVNSEFATLLRSSTSDGVKTTDSGLTRMDVSPVVRYPFTRWPFLTVNSSVVWRGTYWTESLNHGVQTPDGISRQYFTFQSRITGPVFNRIWNTPENSYAEKFKHVIEPTLTISRTSAIDNVDRIVQLEGADIVYGNATGFSYGVNNRLYAKKQTAREILSVALTQSYYTDARSAQVDRLYQSSSYSGAAPSHFTPVALLVRASPGDRLQVDFRTEWDPTKHTLRTLAANGTFSRGSWLQASGGWSQRRYIPGLRGFDRPELADHYLNGAATVRGVRNTIGGTYSFNYDLRRDRFLQQRYMAYYNAQCCGVNVEFQSFNFQGSFAGTLIPRDNRFNVSFTLAGIGTFSNFFGALSGQQDRR